MQDQPVFKRFCFLVILYLFVSDLFSFFGVEVDVNFQVYFKVSSCSVTNTFDCQVFGVV